MAKKGETEKLKLRDLEYKRDIKSSEFLDTSKEWRRLFAEAWGTFLLVLVSTGASVVATQTGEISRAVAFMAPGLIVMTIIYFMGTVSGAHLNPVVTLAFALRNHFPWRRVPWYIVAQFVGGLSASIFLRALLGTNGNLGATIPHAGLENWKAFIIEILITAGLINVILGTSSGPRNIGHNAAIAVGAYIVVTHFWAGPLSGASMNIARSLAPDIVRGNFATSWIYIFAPLLGAAVGVGFEWILKGKPSHAATLSAQGLEEE